MSSSLSKETCRLQNKLHSVQEMRVIERDPWKINNAETIRLKWKEYVPLHVIERQRERESRGGVGVAQQCFKSFAL